MTPDLELTILRAASEEAGYVAGLVVTERAIVAVGGTSARSPTVLASSNARRWESRATPRELGLRDVLAVGDALWVCGEYGQLARSNDLGASWELVETGTEVCLFGLAADRDGAVWVVGEGGYAARVKGRELARVDFGTEARLASALAVKDEVAVLCGDGSLRRWKGGVVRAVATGSAKALTGLAVTRLGTWIVVGDGGFVARSPDGTWWSRAKSGVEVDLEAIAALGDGRLVVVGDRGQILVSKDDGRTWTVVASALTAHLWSVEQFGGGVVIGGDEGMIAKLAPPGDATWADRVDMFGGAKAMDAVFAAGPEGFIEDGLDGYLAVLAEAGADEEDEEGEESDEADGEDSGGEDHEEAGEDEDEDDEEDDHEANGEDAGEDEAFRILARPGDAKSFELSFGTPLPPELAKLRELAAGRDDMFEEFDVDEQLLPDVGEHNLFELLVRRDQHAYLGTGMIEAFSGVCCIGSQGNGDTYHYELYEWDAPRQVLHFDHETHTFSGVFADSLDSLAYLAALAKARDLGAISDDALPIALHKLYGKVAPTWHFSIDDLDEKFQSYEPKRRESEFFFYRARWIIALLKHDGVIEVSDIPRMFDESFNQVVPQDQLPARFDSCTKLIPTALYSLWRAFLFDEPELAKYLELARAHRARIVRDAAKLVDELLGGRNELGTIHDWRAHLAAFRALDLDPRRAGERRAEAEAREREETARKQAAADELARTPRVAWPELAWKWIGDGVAHRALLEQLDRTPAHAAQIAALDELRALRDGEREIALPRLAEALAPELEAVLVGSLLRGDRLVGVLQAPKREVESEDDSDDDSDDDEAPGWDAIDRALAPIYGDGEPHAHYGTALPYALGGNDPIHGISVYLVDAPVPQFHFVTYGFTDLFTKETDDPDESGFGFELTFRLARAVDETDVPNWALNFLQNLGRYVFGTGNRFDIGHKMGLNGPIALGHDTKITAILFAEDPQLGALESPFGRAKFIQIVGITDDEYKLIQEWTTTGLVDMLRKKLPMLVTDLARDSVLDDPALAAEVRARVAAEGSSEEMSFAGDLEFELDEEHVRITLGALYAVTLPRAMRGRIRHGRTYKLRGRNGELELVPGDAAAFRAEEGRLTLVVPQRAAEEIEAKLRGALAGEYRFETWPVLEVVVTPTFIRDQQGNAIEVRGIADEGVAKQMLDEENARVAAEGEGDEDDELDDDDDDEGDEDDRNDAGADDDVPSPARVQAALALTERALRLAPDAEDVQFTHAMLLVDAERAGLDGKSAELLAWLPKFASQTRFNIAARLGELGHTRFGEAVDLMLRDPPPRRVLSREGSGPILSFGDVTDELLAQLGEAIVRLAPDRTTAFREWCARKESN